MLLREGAGLVPFCAMVAWLGFRTPDFLSSTKIAPVAALAERRSHKFGEWALAHSTHVDVFGHG